MYEYDDTQDRSAIRSPLPYDAATAGSQDITDVAE